MSYRELIDSFVLYFIKLKIEVLHLSSHFVPLDVLHRCVESRVLCLRSDDVRKMAATCYRCADAG